MACDLETIQTEACTSGIGKVQDRIALLQIIAQLTCEASQGGGGGGGAYVLTLAGGWESANAAASTTYFIGSDLYNSTRAGNTTYNLWRVRIPKAGTITRVTYQGRIAAASASALNVAHSLRLNDTTDLAPASTPYNVTSFVLPVTISQAVVEGDYVAMKIVTPAYGASLGARWYCTVLIEF